jgi:hypothetical protein
MLLPGGYQTGDVVHFSGARQTFGDGDQLEFGVAGVVLGLSFPVDLAPRIAVRFHGHKEHTNVRLNEISKIRPEIPGGYKVGEKVFWIGENESLSSGERLEFGMQGEVMGRATQGGCIDDTCVAVQFKGNQRVTDVLLDLISSSQPSILGNFKSGERVYFTGAAQQFADGDRLDFAHPGEVLGRVRPGGDRDNERIAVKFDGNKNYTAVRLNEISQAVPVIPGGYSVGDRVCWRGGKRKLTDGDTLELGLQGKVMGRAALRLDGKDELRLIVRFDGRSKNTPVMITAVAPVDVEEQV